MILNIPNKISLTRIALMPVFIFFYLANFIPYGIGKLIALILFIVASVSDAVDGYIARHYNMVTDFGKFLDPIADKLLATTGLVMLLVDHTIVPVLGVIFIFIMLLRDYMVTGLRQMGQLKGVIIAADKYAKIKANFLYVTLILGVFYSYLKCIVTNAVVLTVGFWILHVMVCITIFFIILSGTMYMVHNFGVFLDKKEEVAENNDNN